MTLSTTCHFTSTFTTHHLLIRRPFCICAFTRHLPALASLEYSVQHNCIFISTSDLADMSLNITLTNASRAGIVYAFVTGTAINNGNRLFMLQADGVTPLYPASPSSNGQGIPANVAISLGNPGTTRNITIPYLAGARIWFSYEQRTKLISRLYNGSR